MSNVELIATIIFCSIPALLFVAMLWDNFHWFRYLDKERHEKEELAAGLEFPRPYIGNEKLLAWFFKAVAYAILLKETNHEIRRS